MVYGFLFFVLHSPFPFTHLFLLVTISFSCAVDFPLYWQRAGIKEYQFTYTVLIKCNKIPTKGHYKCFVLALTLENLSE